MTCTLCGLDSGAQEFCCAGCANVHAILLESGVLASGQSFRDTELFRRSLELGLISNTARTTPGESAGPDVSGPYGAQAKAGPAAETREAVFQLSGMWCASCGWLIEHALVRLRGVASAEVLFASDLLKVRYSPQHVPPDSIVKRVASLGYKAAEYTGRNTVSDAERKDLLLRVGVAAFLWMNVMTFSLVVYASHFERVAASFSRFMPFVLMALATPAVFYCEAPVLRIAWTGLRERVLRMESLLAMGILAAYGYSAAVAFAGGNQVYFDTVCAIVTLVLAGKAIERAAKERTSRAVTLLYRLMPNKARLILDGRTRFVALEALQRGAIFRVKSGERIPADGVVVEGRSHVDESVLTGESAPRPKQAGDAVACGSINTGGVLDIRAERVGAESTLARIVRTVEQAAASHTRMERAVDRAARIFIPAVLGIAVLTFAGWLVRTGRPSEALMHAIAVLVIACPCALGVATPLALTTAVASAARRGILVSDARVLETIRAVDVVVLDKTGTATTGEFKLLEAVGDTSRMAELAAVEACSEHPIGRALAGQAGGFAARDITIHTGEGISGVVGETRYFLGNRRLMGPLAARHAASGGLEAPDLLRGGGPDVSGPYERGHGPDVRLTDPFRISGSCEKLEGTVVYFGWDGAVRGALRFGDPLRPEAAGLCSALRQRGIRTVMLSGDARSATERTAAGMGADEWIAEATPEQKVEHIRRLQTAGARVAMIGDGVNDAPSLAQADLGIALGSGTDVALHAAPLVLMGNGLGAVVETLDLGRRVYRVVRQNLFWAFGYNAAGITLAVAGVLNPILAAGAMVLSSVSVIANSRRLG